MPFPGPGDSSDDDTDPELTYDLKGDERTEAVQCDLNSGVLGLSAVSEAAAEDSQCGISTLSPVPDDSDHWDLLEEASLDPPFRVATPASTLRRDCDPLVRLREERDFG